MPLKRQQGIVAYHATAVVSDLDELLSARLDLNCDSRGAGIERIFQEFFYD